MDKELKFAVQESVDYLGSEDAIRSIERNPYWPKWGSPWWHMAVLFEMGLADRIPKTTAKKMLSEVKRTHLPYFFREEIPLDKKADEEVPCPCALGNIYQILSAVGLDVDAELPWARGWFLRYQMPDGGLNCDEDAYKSGEPNASSMVGTIAPLEAIISKNGPLSSEEEAFVDRGAQFLIARELRLGSASRYNSEERDDEGDWLKLCFPRFYFYDVLRGLNFLVKWSDRRKQPIPIHAIDHVVRHLESRFSSGQMKTERQSFEGVQTRIRSDAGDWNQRGAASYFSLLDRVSEIGQLSPFLSDQWQKCKSSLAGLPG